MAIRDLMARRAALITEARAAMDAAPPAGMTDQARAEIDAKINQAEALAADIKRAETLDGLAEMLDQSAGTVTARRGAPAFNRGPLGDDETRAFAHYLRTGRGGPEIRASNATDMNTTTSADGGYAVPTGLYNRIIAKRDEMALFPALGVTPIPGVGMTVNVPTDNGTANEFVSTAQAAAADLDAPALGQAAMTLVKYTKKVTLSDELLNSQDAKLLEFLDNYIARAWAKTHNNLLITEALASGTTNAAAAAAAATATDIPKIVYALKGEYGDNAKFVMRRATEGAYKTLTGNVFQFAPTPAGGADKTLWGFPLYNSSYVNAIATGQKSIVFGDFSYMLMREGEGLQVLRNPYDSAANGQVNVYYYIRAVYKLSVAEAVQYLAHP